MPRSLSVAPLDAHAEPVCVLTRDWAAQRAESPGAFLALATSEAPTGRGIEYRLPATPATWERLEVFVREEGECCPFLAFEAHEEGSDIRLSVTWPEEAL